MHRRGSVKFPGSLRCAQHGQYLLFEVGDGHRFRQIGRLLYSHPERNAVAKSLNLGTVLYSHYRPFGLCQYSFDALCICDDDEVALGPSIKWMGLPTLQGFDEVNALLTLLGHLHVTR